MIYQKKIHFLSSHIKYGFYLQSRKYSTNFNFKSPIRIYSNADTDKLRIIKENKNKSGIYCWTNLVNGHRQ